MNITPLQKRILEIKNIDLENKESLEKFLNPKWDKDIFPSENIKDINKAIERIKKAVDENQKIVIFADYDCDGIPGAVVLHDFFKKINYQNFIVYIPHRHNEGYGLNKIAIEKFIKDKVSLMITVDIGITNLEEIKFAEENNINVILTDHHLPILKEKGEQILPNAFAIINTKQSDDIYEEKYLCGCSTAWKLVNAFLNKYRKDFNIMEGWEKWLLDMVAISTIADLVPLKNENRLLAKYGLEVLKKSKRPGLQKILSNAKITQKNINEDDIAFGIAPRINSASRMAEPLEAFHALLMNEESIDLANKLEKFNNNRKIETKEAVESVILEDLKDRKIVFIGDEKWGPGILGLIAAKICEGIGRTCFVWGMGEDENIMKGSVRIGKDDVNVVEIMTKGREYLENFGGHEAAGGFAIHKDNLKNFENYLKEFEKNIETKEITENINSTKEISIQIEEINKNTFNEIKIFAPFGIENEKPLFKLKLDKENQIKSKRFGKNEEHLEISIGKIRGIEFFVNEKREKELLSKKEFLINIEWDTYRGDIVLKFIK
ncbi:MAG: single-stranded-DNA-specific exonuclease RecJ [Candidatus Nomurabacteria bacterium]